ncbi:MAG: HAMP domain-containing protein [Gammaproteobacteria bacterium]|nr:HAMP domain-containing protein [Gammaproteobacteria bacterium]
MARMKLSLSAAVIAVVVLTHAVLLPVLYFRLSDVVRASHERLFVDHARTFARVLADQLELEGAADPPQRIRDLLDIAILNGDGVYAEYIDGRGAVRSRLGRASLHMPAQQDFSFREHGDHVYFLKLPINAAGRTAELRIGFDEMPTEADIARALRRMFAVLAVYSAVSLAVALYFGVRLARPIRELQDAARGIASGDYAKRLRVASHIGELQDLSADLDHMRRALVGVNQQLRAEIAEKEHAESRRRELESDLRHRQRLETVGTLAGGIAHEFNNALLPIILFTEAALEDLPAESPTREDLTRVLGSARRAREVVRKILTFSHKFDQAQFAVLDLGDAVAESLKLFSALVPSTVTLTPELEPSPMPVRADTALLQQLVMNLGVNAYQSLRKTGGAVTVGLRRAADSAELWVRDNGHGMDEATAARIFEPFFTTRGVGEGTGLGLSVVHGIVESFGARMAVETAVGMGTTFRIFFPIVEDPA